MQTVTEKLDITLNERLKELRAKQTEILLLIGQIHLEIKDLNNSLNLYESEYKAVSEELSTKLSDLEKQFPNGEIDLNEGTITYTK